MRPKPIGLAVGLALAAAGAAWPQPDALGRASAQRLAGAQLWRLGQLAGLRNDRGEAIAQRPLVVDVTQEGGPMWVRPAVVAAVDADPAFAAGDSPHLMRAEFVTHGSALALRLALFRRGWNLKTEHPARVHRSPWVAVLAAAAAAAATLRTRSVGLAIAVAGVLAQVLAALLPEPPSLPGRDLSDAWREGPLGEAVVGWARALPDGATAIGVGVVVLCAVLIAFDHRRSHRSGGKLVALGLVGGLGLVAWVEASLRTGLLAWLATPAGWIGVAGLALVWGVAGSRRPSA